MYFNFCKAFSRFEAKMCTKIIFFIATLYVVNASVILLDDYDDNVQSLVDLEDGSTLRSCNNQECHQRCRRLKFPGGICVNGRCKCDNFRAAEELFSLSKCKALKCNRRCRKLNFAGGTCVNETCQCNAKFRTEEGDGSFADGIVDNEVEESDLSLNKALDEDSEADIADVSSDPKDLSDKRRCFTGLCNHVCRLKRLGTGTCIDGRCKCSKNKVNELSAAGVSPNNESEESVLKLDDEVEDAELEIAELFSDPTELSEKRRCSPRRCNRICRLRRFNNGTCVDGRCRCSNKVNESSAAGVSPNNESEESLLKLENEVEDAELEVTELFSDPTELSEKRRCSPRRCNRVCRLRRFNNGTCVDGRCRCSNKVNESSAAGVSSNNESELKLNEEVEETEVGIADLFLDPADLSEKRRCSPRRCNRVCRLRQFSNGTCVDGRCKCSNKVARSFVEDIPDHLVEESDLNVDEVEGLAFESEKLKLNFDEKFEDTEAEIAEFSSDPTDVSEKRRCLPRLCNIVCRLKHLGNGTCVDGRCKCSGRVEKSFADDEADNLVVKSNLNMDKIEDVALNNGAEEPELSLNEEVEGTEAEIAEFFSDPRDLSEKRRCFPRLCNRLCRLKRFANGTCVQGRCKCQKKVQESTTPASTTAAGTTVE